MESSIENQEDKTIYTDIGETVKSSAKGFGIGLVGILGYASTIKMLSSLASSKYFPDKVEAVSMGVGFLSSCILISQEQAMYQDNQLFMVAVATNVGSYLLEKGLPFNYQTKFEDYKPE